MRSIFAGFNTAVLGMQAQRKATDITSHNIANANTDGYTRQRPKIAATQPFSYGGAGQVGTGATVQEIERIRDGFLDYQVRSEKQLQGYWEARKDGLSQVETLFMEPSDTSFNTVLGDFFDAWQELSVDPESSPVRTHLVETSETLINTINHLDSQMDNLKRDTNEMIKIKAEEINNLSNQIANLNKQIVTIKNRGDSPNDLMDRRDLLIDELSEIVDCKVINNENGSATLLLRGRDLVREGNSNKIIADYEGENVELYWEDKGEKGPKINIYREESMVSRRDTLEGLHSVREDISYYQEEFNTLVDSVVHLVNDKHSSGYNLDSIDTDIEYESGIERLSAKGLPGGEYTIEKDGEEGIIITGEINGEGVDIDDLEEVEGTGEDIKVFTFKVTDLDGKEYDGELTLYLEEDGLAEGNNLASFTVNKGDFFERNSQDKWAVASSIKEDVKNIAASTHPDEVPGNGLNALDIAQLRDQRLYKDEEDCYYRLPEGDEVGQTTLESFYRDTISSLGVKSQESHRMVENQESLLTQLENRRESISGVSLDEEMSNLMMYQHAYQAAARVITTLDTMLDTVVNRMAVR